jgi:hypothetical protein
MHDNMTGIPSLLRSCSERCIQQPFRHGAAQALVIGRATFDVISFCHRLLVAESRAVPSGRTKSADLKGGLLAVRRATNGTPNAPPMAAAKSVLCES